MKLKNIVCCQYPCQLVPAITESSIFPAAVYMDRYTQVMKYLHFSNRNAEPIIANHGLESALRGEMLSEISHGFQRCAEPRPGDQGYDPSY